MKLNNSEATVEAYRRRLRYAPFNIQLGNEQRQLLTVISAVMERGARRSVLQASNRDVFSNTRPYRILT